MVQRLWSDARLLDGSTPVSTVAVDPLFGRLVAAGMRAAGLVAGSSLLAALLHGDRPVMPGMATGMRRLSLMASTDEVSIRARVPSLVSHPTISRHPRR